LLPLINMVRGRAPSQRGLARTLYLALLALGPGPAIVHAEVWGFIDDNGVAHVAGTKMDERYQLFFKGKSGLDPSHHLAGDASLTPLAEAKIFERIQQNPNVKASSL